MASSALKLDTDALVRFARFISEREAVRVARESGAPRPWTKDPILRSYRFCNVHREDDAVTRWIAREWRDPHKDDPDVWFAMCVARLFNLSASLVDIGYPVPFDPQQILTAMARRAMLGAPQFNGAYLINQTAANGKGLPKYEYVTNLVLRPMWAARDYLRPRKSQSLRTTHNKLCEFNGFGSFMAGQVVADVKYTPLLQEAEDWWTFAASGPGSRRGLNRLCNREPNTHWNEAVWYATLMDLRVQASLFFKLHAQDLQNCLCEWDKYERVRTGQGRPKTLYNGV